jgi:hypothetical protein
VHDQEEIISTLDLSETDRDILKYRWLAQITRLEDTASSERRTHERLRRTAILGAAVASALVGTSAALPSLIPPSSATAIAASVGVLALIVNLGVTAALGLDAAFRHAERYRETRLVTELLRIEGSRYFSLADSYAAAAGGPQSTHRTQFPRFMAQVEHILERDAYAWVAFAVTSPSRGATDRSGGDVQVPAA